jgi:hypothetical protein
VLPLGITYPFPIPLDIYLSEVETDE